VDEDGPRPPREAHGANLSNPPVFEGDSRSAGPLSLATLSRRFGALLLDWIMCLLVAGWFGRHIGNPWTSAVLVVEYAFFVGLFTQTPGMWVARIRCVSITTGGPIGVPRAALRGLLLALVIPALIMDKRTWRGLHDRAAGSVMVSTQASQSNARTG
jgi:uncharacterized RDD family membrane protein YckC